MMSQTTSQETTVRLSRILSAPPERVYHAWTTVQGLKHWAAPGTMTVPFAAVDLRVGGRYEIHMLAPDGAEHRVAGIYREIDAPHRLVYTWQWQNQPGAPDTVVTVEFRPHAKGTELTIVHHLPDAESQARHEHGWIDCLEKLRVMLS